MIQQHMSFSNTWARLVGVACTVAALAGCSGEPSDAGVGQGVGAGVGEGVGRGVGEGVGEGVGQGLSTRDGQTVIAFGSCAQEGEPQPIWDAIIAQDPGLFLFIGDNVYMDLWKDDAGEFVMEAPTLSIMQQAYDDFAKEPGWQSLKAACPVMATWDDHDYGDNDAGKEWKYKDESQAMFEEFYELSGGLIPDGQQGVYHAKTFGEPGRRVQVIMLDTRYHRDALTKVDPRPEGRGPYVKGEGDFLGEAQWAWLEGELRKPADLRVIASSIQVVADEHGWESWGNLPAARERLYSLIDETGANGVVFISGDRHLIEICKDAERGPYEMWDFTSSGFNWGESDVSEGNSYRVGPVLREPNFGVLRVDWDAGTVTMEGRGLEAEVLMREVVAIKPLRSKSN